MSTLLLISAVLPAVYLLRYVYNLDRVEKEPPQLLFRLLLGGVGAALASIILESVGEAILGLAPVEYDSDLYNIILAFLVVAVIEEGTKYYFMHRTVWRNPSFNYRFDGIVYAVFASLGFAAFENISYVMSYGLGTAIVRAVLSVPGHMAFSVVYGTFYGRAKYFSNRGNEARSKYCIWTGYILAVFLHGFYDACAMIGSDISSLIFIVFVILMYVIIFRLIHRESETDGIV